MKTIEDLAKFSFEAMDNRDLYRLAQYIPEDKLSDFGLELKEDLKGTHKHKELTKENILEELKGDVAFGFEKALNKRGLSSLAMYSVVRMWNFILDEDLEEFDNYNYYGLPLFKATALKYGFDNPIGEDKGYESKYNCD